MSLALENETALALASDSFVRTSSEVEGSLQESVKSQVDRVEDEVQLSSEVWTTGRVEIDLKTITDAVSGLFARLRLEKQARRDIETRIDRLDETATQALALAKFPRNSRDSADGDVDWASEEGKTVSRKEAKIQSQNPSFRRSVTRSKQLTMSGTLSGISEAYRDDSDEDVDEVAKRRTQRMEARFAKIENDMVYHRRQLEQKSLGDMRLLDMKIQSLQNEVDGRASPADLHTLRHQLIAQIREGVSQQCRDTISGAVQDKTANLCKQAEDVCHAVTQRMQMLEDRLHELQQNIKKEQAAPQQLEDMVDNHTRRLDELARRVHAYKGEVLDIDKKLGLKHDKLVGRLSVMEQNANAFTPAHSGQLSRAATIREEDEDGDEEAKPMGRSVSLPSDGISQQARPTGSSSPTQARPMGAVAFLPSDGMSQQESSAGASGWLPTSTQPRSDTAAGKLREELMTELHKNINARLQMMATKGYVDDLRRSLEDKFKDQRLILEAEAERIKEGLPDAVGEEFQKASNDLRKEIAEVRADAGARGAMGAQTPRLSQLGSLKAELREWLEDAKARFLASVLEEVRPAEARPPERVRIQDGAKTPESTPAPSHVGFEPVGTSAMKDIVVETRKPRRPSVLDSPPAEGGEGATAVRAANTVLRERIKLMEVRLTAVEEWVVTRSQIEDAAAALSIRSGADSQDGSPGGGIPEETLGQFGDAASGEPGDPRSPEVTTVTTPPSHGHGGDSVAAMRRFRDGNKHPAPLPIGAPHRTASTNGRALSGRPSVAHSPFATAVAVAELARRLEEMEQNLAQHGSVLAEHASATNQTAEDGRREVSNVARAIRNVQRQGEQSMTRIEDVSQDLDKFRERTEECMSRILAAMQALRAGAGGGGEGEHNREVSGESARSELCDLFAAVEEMGTSKKVENLLTTSLAALRADIANQIGQLRTEMHDNLSKKANRLDLQSLITKVHCLLGPDGSAPVRTWRAPTPEPSGGGRGAGGGSPERMMQSYACGHENAAAVKWPRCLSCDTPVEVISDAGRLRTVAMVPSRMATPTPMSSPTPPPLPTAPNSGHVGPTLPPAPGAAPPRRRHVEVCG